MKQIGVTIAEIGLSKTLIEKLNLESKLLKLKKEHYDLIKDQKATDLQIKCYTDFEELVFNLSKADGQISTEELLKKNTYDFYSYKKLLLKHLNRKKKKDE